MWIFLLISCEFNGQNMFQPEPQKNIQNLYVTYPSSLFFVTY